MEKMPITRDGYNKLKKELDHLKTVMVPENIRDIEIARAHGDLSENAEYTAAKERQAFLHGKRQELENNLMMSKIIDISNITKEKVVFGSSVVIEDTNTSETITYQLLGPFESDINEKKISVTSPIGKALIGKAVGEEVNVKTPGGVRQFEIIDIF
jgi:transcription elongation factor GreA